MSDHEDVQPDADGVLVFKLVKKSVPVKFEVPEEVDGTIVLDADNSPKIVEMSCRIVELDGAGRDMFFTKSSKRANYVGGKLQGVKSFDGVQTDLLALCLVDNSTGKFVPQATMQKWPASVLEQLDKVAKKLSRLDPEKKADEEEEAKNS